MKPGRRQRRELGRLQQRPQLRAATRSHGWIAKSVRRYEACDDGNDVETDGCTSSCLVARCGDGLVPRTPPRAARTMKPATMATRSTRTPSRNDCSLAFCGDGVLRTDLSDDHPDFEACDDGNEVETDQCLSNCEVARCGTVSWGLARAVMTPTTIRQTMPIVAASDLRRRCHPGRRALRRRQR